MALTVAAGLGAPLLAGNPTRMDVSVRLARPSAAHWFGTDDVGRDVFSRVVHGARLSLLVGAAVVTLSFVVGVSCGLVAGFYRALDNAAAVLIEAALSFLGAGVPPYVPSWGNILSEGRLYIQQAPWLVLYPGAAIMLTILGLSLVGDGLRDVLDPKIRSLQTDRQPAG